jgi:hypothetical protein
MCRQRRHQRREVLPLAVAAEDHHQALALGAESFERGHRGADIGALGVVVVLDVVDPCHQFDPVRLAAIGAQRMQHRRQRAADGARQRQRRQRVERVMAAAHLQRIHRHQLVHVDLPIDAGQLARRLAAAMTEAQVLRIGEPGQSAIAHEAVVVRLRGCAQADRHRMRRRALAPRGAFARDAFGLGDALGHRTLVVDGQLGIVRCGAGKHQRRNLRG